MKIQEWYASIFQRKSFFERIYSSLTIFIFILIGIITLFYIAFGNYQLIQNIKAKGNSLAQIIARNTAYPLLIKDQNGIHKVLESIKESNRDVSYALITNEKGEYFMSIGSNPIGDLRDKNIIQKELLRNKLSNARLRLKGLGTTYQFSIPIQVEDIQSSEDLLFGNTSSSPKKTKTIGYLFMGLSATEIHTLLLKMFSFGIAILLIFTAAGRFAIQKFNKNNLNIVSDFIKQMKAIGSGNLSQKIEIHSGDELETLGTSLNQMTDQLRNLATDIKDAENKISSTSIHLVTATEQQAQSTQSQSAIIKQVDNTLKDLAGSAALIAQKMTEINQLGQENKNLAESSKGEIEKSVVGILEVEKTIESVNATLKNLEQQSHQISDIIHFIQEVADRTDLLALNASIEAARVGEEGKGFTVLASEIRKLAERSKTSANDIRSLLLNIQSQTETVVGAMQQAYEKVGNEVSISQKTNEVFSKMMKSIELSSSAVREVAVSAQQQNSASRQASLVMDQITEAIRQFQVSTHQTVSSASELNDLSNHLKKAIELFKY